MTDKIAIRKQDEGKYFVYVNGILVHSVSGFNVKFDSQSRCFVASIEYYRGALGKYRVDEFRDFTLTME